MARRSQAEMLSSEFFELFLLTPAWVGPVVAILAFIVLRYILPVLLSGMGEPLGPVLSTISVSFALWAFVILLGIWGFAELQKWLRRRLLDRQGDLASIRNLPWQVFEHLVGEAYRRRGYVVEEVGSPSGDGGVDLKMHGTDGLVLVQCKQWRIQRVGVKPVRELYGVMVSEKAARAILVTSGSFTQEAQRFAVAKPLELVDGKTLWELVRDVSTSQSAPSVKASATASEPTTEFERLCPACGAKMVRRVAKRGQRAGQPFWGCSRYPACRGIRDEFR